MNVLRFFLEIFVIDIIEDGSANSTTITENIDSSAMRYARQISVDY